MSSEAADSNNSADSLKLSGETDDESDENNQSFERIKSFIGDFNLENLR